MSAAIGFKEWQAVCEALASGRQALILRKGGIHEGRAGFSFAHEEFFLFPTRFHGQAGRVREVACEALPEWREGEVVRVTHHVEALWASTLTDWRVVQSLEPFHVWTEDTVRERFDWEGKGMASGSIHAALVRVAALGTPWEFPYAANYGGCRSWVTLPEPPAGWREGLAPVMGDDAFATLAARLEEITASSARPRGAGLPG